MAPPVIGRVRLLRRGAAQRSVYHSTHHNTMLLYAYNACVSDLLPSCNTTVMIPVHGGYWRVGARTTRVPTTAQTNACVLASLTALLDNSLLRQEEHAGRRIRQSGHHEQNAAREHKSIARSRSTICIQEGVL